MRTLISSIFLLLGVVACQTQGADKQPEASPEIKAEQAVDEIPENPPITEVEEEKEPFKKIEFPSKDGLTITGDYYEVAESQKPPILLCHQAGFSRGEYREIAPKLNAMGFTCLAIDQRSGSAVNKVKNETSARAGEKGLERSYLYAEQDIRAAIDYLAEKSSAPVIIWGSSYSASLVLKIGKDEAKAGYIISFSPGEYFRGMSLAETISGLDKPVFVTSSRKESKGVTTLVKGVNQKKLTQYIPESSGVHGSRALWESRPDEEGYWKAVTAFLNEASK